jgi:predicted HAD superfamily Cof-like phosphohydrolase
MKHKKQAYNLIEDICKLNNDVWNNKAGSYDDKQEAAYQIEEALEGFDDSLHILKLGIDKYIPKEVSRAIVNQLTVNDTVTDRDRFDKHLDSIYFDIGALHRLGLSPEQIVEGLQAVHDANVSKTGQKDSSGKVIKADNFINPEPVLEKILNNRQIK